MKHRVKVQYTVDHEAVSQGMAIAKATALIPEDTTNIHVECWTPKTITPLAPGLHRVSAETPIANIEQADASANAHPPYEDEHGKPWLYNEANGLWDIPACPKGCGHPVATHGAGGCFTHVPKNTVGACVLETNQEHDFCGCNWEGELAAAGAALGKADNPAVETAPAPEVVPLESSKDIEF